jgi:hypothetical protein
MPARSCGPHRHPPDRGRCWRPPRNDPSLRGGLSREECDRHAEHHDHRRVCAGACRRCEQACNDILATTG